MISLMTFDATPAGRHGRDHFLFETLPDPHGLDLLCCQSLAHDPDGRMEGPRWLPAALGLTRSCFAATRTGTTAATVHDQPTGGLAIFTGSRVWVLNSGTFSIGEGEEATLVQFALIRKLGVSLLALNLHLGAARPTQLRQLDDLFAHALLRESYGAVTLCANRTPLLTDKQWRHLAARSSYAPHSKPLTGSAGGLLGLFTPKGQATAEFAVGDLPATLNMPYLALTVDVQRLGPAKPNRPTFPLSFREQWLGYRDRRAFA